MACIVACRVASRREVSRTEYRGSEPCKVALLEIETIRSSLIDEFDVALVHTTAVKAGGEQDQVRVEGSARHIYTCTYGRHCAIAVR